MQLNHSILLNHLFLLRIYKVPLKGQTFLCMIKYRTETSLEYLIKRYEPLVHTTTAILITTTITQNKRATLTYHNSISVSNIFIVHIYTLYQKITLSDCLPMLENLRTQAALSFIWAGLKYLGTFPFLQFHLWVYKNNNIID